jgi:hypothetical protein
MVVCIFVPGKKQLTLQAVVRHGEMAADARAAKANETPAPTTSFDAARKLRRDLISVIFSDDMSMAFLLAASAFYSLKGREVHAKLGILVCINFGQDQGQRPFQS